MDDILYRGHGAGSVGAGRLVTVERNGQVVGVLRHVVRHSPTGITWGYDGSGCADLARSLLIDTLGEDAYCPACRGAGKVVYHVASDVALPYDIAQAEGLGEGDSEVMECPDCGGDRYRSLPYQQFKRAVVADLPATGWTLTRAEIREWLTVVETTR